MRARWTNWRVVFRNAPGQVDWCLVVSARNRREAAYVATMRAESEAAAPEAWAITSAEEIQVLEVSSCATKS